MPIRHRSLRFGPLEAVAVASLLVAAAAFAAPGPRVRDEVRREERALVLLRRVAAAEQAFLAKKTLDANGDGVPEYGPLAALVKAGVLDAAVRSDASGTFLEESGYRLEVLLPSGPLPGGGVSLARSTERVDPALSARTFAVVALPQKGAGRRALYLDPTDRLYQAEGVNDDEGKSARAFPARVLERKDEDLKDGSTIWRRPDDPEPPRKPR